MAEPYMDSFTDPSHGSEWCKGGHVRGLVGYKLRIIS